jgi:predicted Fe-Mo cluster-binding NifX family protein
MQGASLCSHLGLCDRLLIAEVDRLAGIVRDHASAKPRRRDCESLPGWLKMLDVSILLVDQLSPVAAQRLCEAGLQVLAPGPEGTPLEAAARFAAGEVVAPPSLCRSHEHHHHCAGRRGRR